MPDLQYIPNLNVALAHEQDDRLQVLVNTVNTVGVMGKGVALAFREAWPGMLPAYQALCRARDLRPGDCKLITLRQAPPLYMAALATKESWRAPSTYSWVLKGLARLRLEMERLNLTGCALPPPGCGNGGLDWPYVHEMIDHVFGEAVTLGPYRTIFAGPWPGHLVITASEPSGSAVMRQKLRTMPPVPVRLPRQNEGNRLVPPAPG